MTITRLLISMGALECARIDPRQFSASSFVIVALCFGHTKRRKFKTAGRAAEVQNWMGGMTWCIGERPAPSHRRPRGELAKVNVSTDAEGQPPGPSVVRPHSQQHVGLRWPIVERAYCQQQSQTEIVKAVIPSTAAANGRGIAPRGSKRNATPNGPKCRGGKNPVDGWVHGPYLASWSEALRGEVLRAWQ